MTPFRKILVANRGEIARRIFRTARALGYRTVAVYSPADADSLHVQEADQAVGIGGARNETAESYLAMDAILAAARLSGADAVHPGYGFLAENERFARACRDAGLVFIGPSPEAMRAMGNKAEAKRTVLAAGVPCLPGYQERDQDDARLAEEAARLGFPLMIKAAAGGGGRGMRLASAASELPELLLRARSEARSAFGDDTVILERAVRHPRHVEVQIFADRAGHVLHLGERDCSVQRRHQKLIEETPSPAVSPELRARMGELAVRAVKTVRYEGAGTVEFLLDPAGEIFFLEMNTRLQVEHPITEAVTGLDLVEWQLRVATGEDLPLTQDEVRFSGHAIEVRLCAEDADRDFLPQSGRMLSWSLPARPQLRVETAMHPGAEVTPFYDSMIAKIVAVGASREEARRTLLAAVEDVVALGVTTNQRFLARCLAHPAFARGDATTAFVAEHQGELLTRDPDTDARAMALTAVLLAETPVDPAATATAAATAADRRVLERLPRAARFSWNGVEQSATLVRQAQRHHQVKVGESSFDVRVVSLDANGSTGTGRVCCDGLVESLAWARDGHRLILGYRGATFAVIDRTRTGVSDGRRGQTSASGVGEGRLSAAMNGRVVAVLAAVGDVIAAGQPIVTVEAMKMENAHSFRVSGTITAVHVTLGDQIRAQHLLAEIK